MPRFPTKKASNAHRKMSDKKSDEKVNSSYLASSDMDVMHKNELFPPTQICLNQFM